MGQLDGVWVWKQQKLSLDTKVCLYSSLVLSAFLYGFETWATRKVDSEKIQAFHMTSQRRILGIKWLDYVKNTAVSEKTGLKDLPLIIADRRHSLFGHICRLSAEVPAHHALQLCIDASSGILPAPDWGRPPGRPRRTWIKQVEEDLGLPVSAAWITAMDRSTWSTLRPSAGHAQQWMSELLCLLIAVPGWSLLLHVTNIPWLITWRHVPGDHR